MPVLLFLGSLPFEASSQAVAGHLWDWVVPQAVVVGFDRVTGRSKGFGFATVENPEDAFIACRANGSYLDGCRVVVNVAVAAPSHATRWRDTPVQNYVDNAAGAPFESISSSQLQIELLQALDRADAGELWVQNSVVRFTGDARASSEPRNRQMARLVELLAESPELLAELHPRLFEHLIAALLSASGYQEIRLTVPSSDGGIDIYATRNSGLGRSVYLIQCKRYAPGRKVTRPEAQLTYGVLCSSAATKMAITTTSCFTRPAEEFLREHSHRLSGVDGQDLRRWLEATRQVLHRGAEPVTQALSTPSEDVTS